MSEVTHILSAIEQGDPNAAEQLLPLVYDELRQLAAQKIVQEKPGQTLQATALVHEAYIRLVDVELAQQWHSRGHFFAAAAEAMRRILVPGRDAYSNRPYREHPLPAVNRRFSNCDSRFQVLAFHRTPRQSGGPCMGNGSRMKLGARSSTRQSPPTCAKRKPKNKPQACRADTLK
jgi:hypothetical protein